MGVPVLTMAGYNFNSRCGESINKNLNMEQMIAKDEMIMFKKLLIYQIIMMIILNLRKSVFLKCIKKSTI